MIVSLEVRDAVARGAEKLDSYLRHPSWRRRCKDFIFGDSTQCVLTKAMQTNFLNALRILKIEDKAGYYGFDCDITNDKLVAMHQQAWQDEFDNPPLGTDDDPQSEEIGFDHIEEFRR